jgi:hypothetical protein
MPITKNADGCCVYTPTPESKIIETVKKCTSSCKSEPANTCGITHPECSGTLAGCKSTTLPHFGVVMNEAPEGRCRPFGYYTSGNTEEYEGVCGDIQKLSCEKIEQPCAKKIVLSTEPCDCFENKAAAGVVDAAKLQELEDKIAANEDNTVVDTIIENNKVYNVLEDGTKVEVHDVAVDLEGKLVDNS